MSIIKRTANRSPFLYLYVLFSAFCRRCGFCGCLSCCSGCFSSGLHFPLLLSDYSVVVGICKEQSIMRAAVYAIFTDSSSDTCLYNLSVSNNYYSIGAAISLIIFVITGTLSLAVYVRTAAYKQEDTFQ